MKVIIQSPRANLRAFQLSDYDDLLVLMINNEVMKETGFKRPLVPDEVKEQLNRWVLNVHAPLGVWCARDKKTQDFIGWFMLKPSDQEVPELGFMINPLVWGQGFATEISEAIIQYAKNTLNLEKVIARANNTNQASLKVLKKIGMKVIDEIHSTQETIQFQLTL